MAGVILRARDFAVRRGIMEWNARILGSGRILIRMLLSLCAALLALGLATPAPAQDTPAAPDPVPRAVIEAIQAAPSPGQPEQVIVGAYINDIQELDFKANNYVVDLYVWFRWKSRELDPSKTMEFMNRYASDDNIREALFEAPMEMPDGSLYSIVRYQGRFATKFPLEDYPFDTQLLRVVMEDTVTAADKQVYAPDANGGVGMNPEITLPGFHVGKPVMEVTSNTYPTNFGDLSQPDATAYSRLNVTVPVTRPIVAMSIKTFVPILLIVICSALVFFVRPRYIEGRIGLCITALLTLVALQLASGSSLPDVDYLMMLDKIYLLAYVFIIIALARVVSTSWRGAGANGEMEIARKDRIWFGALLAAYLLANVVVAWTTLA